MSDSIQVREARARGEADAAKDRLMGDVGELKARLAPAKLKSDAVQAVKNKSIVAADTTVSGAKKQPGMAGGMAAGLLLLLARKPLFAAVRRWWNRDKYSQTQGSRQRAGAMEEI